MADFCILGEGIKRYQFGVIDCCEALHSACTGSGDPLHPVEGMCYYYFLKYRIKTWSDPSCKYDDLVCELCHAAINEYEQRWFTTDEAEIIVLESKEKVQDYMNDLLKRN